MRKPLLEAELARLPHDDPQTYPQILWISCPLLGWLLYPGLGLPRDYHAALRLFSSAAQQGDTRGMTWLALCLLHGHGVTADTQRAAGLFEQATQRGSQLAQCWREAAADGVVSASFCLGMCLYAGEGVPADAAEATEHFTKFTKDHQEVHGIFFAQFGVLGVLGVLVARVLWSSPA